jgi:hypothetical protein
VANFIQISLDTSAPVLTSISVGSVERTKTQGHNVSFSVSGGADVAQYKLWGSSSGMFSNPSATTEGAATWQDFTEVGTPNDVAVTIDGTEDGAKTLYAKIRDDVGNESGSAFDSITYDTTGPSLTAIILAGGAAKTGSTTVSVSFTISPSDAYVSEALIWGDLSNNETSKLLAENGTGWQGFTEVGTANDLSAGITTGDGTKTVYAVVRDDLANESAQRSDSIELDQTAPVVQVLSGPTPAKISKTTGYDSSVFVWYWEATTDEVAETGTYAIKVGGSSPITGTQIPTTGGSSGVSGNITAAGDGTPEGAVSDTEKHITTTVKGADLETAGAEGSNRCNIYVTDNYGNTTPYGG